MKTWKDISPLYSVSNEGEVMNKKTGKTLKTYLARGYEAVNLHSKTVPSTRLIHRLVAYMFVPNPNKKERVNHKDGNAFNNHAENLEWCTQKENLHHSRNVTRNGAVVSLKEIKRLYKDNPGTSIEEFITLLEAAAK